EDLLAASSLSQLSLQTSKVVGPLLGGVVLAIAGPRAAFILDAVTFVASAAILSRLPYVAHGLRSHGGETQGFFVEFREGLAYIVRRRTLAVAVGGMGAALFMIFLFDSLGALALKKVGLSEAL